MLQAVFSSVFQHRCQETNAFTNWKHFSGRVSVWTADVTLWFRTLVYRVLTDMNQLLSALKSPKSKNKQKCWPTCDLCSPLSACWPEEEDRVSYWQGLYGARQRKLQPVQLRGLKTGKTLMVQSPSLLLQWTLTFIIFNTATDAWMDPAPQDQWFCQGSVILWTACPLKTEYCPFSQRCCCRGQTEKTHTCCCLPFFFKERKNIYFQT